jgi:hypothetical protein
MLALIGLILAPSASLPTRTEPAGKPRRIEGDSIVLKDKQGQPRLILEVGDDGLDTGKATHPAYAERSVYPR